MNRLLIILFFSFLEFSAVAQSPTAGFELSPSACLDELLLLKNNSISGNSYEWDFCVGDFSTEPTSEFVTVNGLPTMNLSGVKFIYENGNYYSFWLDRPTLGKVYLAISPSQKISENTTFTKLNAFDSYLKNPEIITMIKDANGVWVMYVGHMDVGYGIVRAKFGNGLDNEPTIVENIGYPTNNRVRGLRLLEDAGTFYLAVSLFEQKGIAIIDLGNDPFNSFTASSIYPTTSITGVNQATGIEFVNKDGNWIAFIGSQATGNVSRINYGNSLLNVPVHERTYTFDLGQTADLKIMKEAGNYFLIAASSNKPIKIINLGSLNEVNSFQVIEPVNIPRSFSFEILDSASVKSLIVAQVNRVDYYNFQKQCAEITISYSKEESPVISYSYPGTYPITLTATDESGNTSSTTKQITVLDQQAPQISIQTDVNLCLDNSKTFTAQNLTPNQTLTSLFWDFGDGTTATGTEVTHQYTSPGTYKVRLTVESDGGCGNFIEKEVNIYPAPDPEFSFSAGVLCTNGAITFENSTPGEYNDDVTWTWDFGDGTTSAEKEPSHIYATGGTKTVTLKASIPGCEATVNHELEVIPGPSVDFSASNLCLGEEVQFSNLSTGSSITDYAWDFGNGEASTAENPTVTYAAAGTYEVSLTVNNTSGCSNTLTKSIVIHSLPEVDFDHALVCSGSPTPFEDRSTVEDGSISSWLWNFGDGTTSTEKNPVHIFDGPGSYEVKLKVSSSWGCIDSTKQLVQVKSSPKADFVVERGCPGTTSRFIDTSTIPEGDQIVKRVWVINSASFFSENPEIKFSLPGTYSATLTVTSSNGCQSSITREVIIDPLPAPDFTFTNACVGELTAFTDLSQAFGDDEIIDWQWQFGNMAISNDQHPEVNFTNAGDVPVTLTVTTDRGCAVSIHKTVTISALPSAAFTTQTNLGAPPLRVNFKNNTSGAVSYQWWFGDPDNSTSTEENPAFVYTTLGEYEAKLIATNAAGCTDTASMMIKTLIPKLEVALEQLSTFNTSGDLQLVLKITNKGSIRIEDMDITLDLGGQLKVKEHFSGSIAAGESVNYPLSFEILKENMVRVPYVCASLSIVNTEYSEENLEDNSACKDIAKEFVLLTPFPNPVNGTFYVNFVMPEKAPVRLLITDMLGETVVDKALPDAKVGYNSYDFNFSSLTAGMYVIKVIHGGQTHLRKVVVR